MFSNPRTLKWTGIGVAVGVVLILLYLRMIQVKPVTDTERDKTKGENPLEKARATLRRSSDLSACRAAFQQLNALLSQKKDLKLPTLSTDERDALKREAGLTTDDLAELEQTSFTLLDGLYLEASLLFRDAARGLTPRQKDMPRTPEQEAAALFAWTVRQVPIVEGLPFEGGEPILPPELGVRRGIGSPMTRALVFLELLRQQGLDGCLLSFPSQTGKTIRYWACGVRGSENRLYLFDPALGLPLPGREGKGIATFDALLKDASLLTQLDSEPLEWIPKSVAGTEFHLVVPLSSLAPRLRYLEKEVLDVSGGGRVVADLGMAEQFRTALKDIDPKGVVKIAPWAVRMQRSFYPSNEGGNAPPPVIQRFRGELIRQNILPLKNAIPASILGKFDELPYSKRFVDAYANRLHDFFQGPGQPRDLQLRGEFANATRELGTMFDNLQITADTYRTNFDPEPVVQWYEAAFAATAGKTTANFPRGAEKMVDLMISGASAESLLPHVSYLRALVKHEQAERAQYRLGESLALKRPEDAKELEQDWKEVRDIWDDYLFRNTLNVPAEVTRQAKALQARGQNQLAEAVQARARLAGSTEKAQLEEQAKSETKKALDYWQDLARDRKDAASIGYRFQAKQREGRK